MSRCVVGRDRAQRFSPRGRFLVCLALATALGGCIPPEKALEEDLQELLAAARLPDEVIFCRVSEGSRTGMCTVRTAGEVDLARIVSAFGMGEIDPADPKQEEALALWDDRVSCPRLSVFAPENRGPVFRAPAGPEPLRLARDVGFERLVAHGSAISDLVCFQVAYAAGREPGWRPTAR